MILDLAQIKRIDTADVFKGDVRAGQLRRVEGGVAFVYDRQYLAQNGAGVAWTLPPRPEPYLTGGGAVPAFFAGLLPEGARLHAVIAAVKTSPDDELSLLLAVGSDAVGDISVVQAGKHPRDPSSTADVDDPSQVSFDELFARSIDPANPTLDRAIPGVQDKLSDALVSFPLMRGAGPAILKLSPDRYPRLVENEAFFLAMARDCGFRVPRFRVIHDRIGTSGLLVERFDRILAGERVVRLAQEDACQLAGRWPAEKYRMSMREVIETVNQVVSAPRAAGLELVLLTAFSYLIANGDMHAKNISVRWLPDQERVELTPAYDLLTTRPYPVDYRLALHVDGKENRIRGHDLVAFAQRFRLPDSLVRRKLDDICDRAEPFLDRVGEIGFDDRTTEQIAQEMRLRIDQLRE